MKFWAAGLAQGQTKRTTLHIPGYESLSWNWRKCGFSSYQPLWSTFTGTGSVLGTGVTKMNNSLSCTQEVCTCNYRFPAGSAVFGSALSLQRSRERQASCGTREAPQSCNRASSRGLTCLSCPVPGNIFSTPCVLSISIWMSKWTAWWLGVNWGRPCALGWEYKDEWAMAFALIGEIIIKSKFWLNPDNISAM